MVKLEIDGVDRIAKAFQKMTYTQALKIVRYSIYPGAGIVMDAVRTEVEEHHSITGDMGRSVALGKMKTVGDFTRTRLQWIGYDEKGVPNVVKARALESGTSDGRIQATHFVSKTVEGVKADAVKAMQEAFDKKISEILGERPGEETK